MVEPQFLEQTLFGQWPAQAQSEGEFYVGQTILNDWDEMRSRAEWCMDYLEQTGNLLLEVEDHNLLADCMKSYIYGLYPAAVITADALIERLLTDFLESKGLAAQANGTLGKKIAALEQRALLDENVLRRISHLHRVRNNLAHEKGPDDQYRLFRRALSERRPHEWIMRDDAKEAVMLAYGIAARIKRGFPRMGTVG